MRYGSKFSLLLLLCSSAWAAAGPEQYNGRYVCRQNFPDGQSLADQVNVQFKDTQLQSLSWASTLVLNNSGGKKGQQTGWPCDLEGTQIQQVTTEGKNWLVDLQDPERGHCQLRLSPQGGSLRIEPSSEDCRQNFCGAHGHFPPLLLQSHSGRCKYLPEKQ